MSSTVFWASFRFVIFLAVFACFDRPARLAGQRGTAKPGLYGRHWVAVTGKPLAATAGARIFLKGGNAVDAACAMIAATSTMWDMLSLGRRDASPDLQSENKKGHRHQRPRRGPDRCDRGVLQIEEYAVSA